MTDESRARRRSGPAFDRAFGARGALARRLLPAPPSHPETERLRTGLVLARIAWVPLLFLTVLSGPLLPEGVTVPFLKDFEVHVRFLLVLPLLFAGEVSPRVGWRR